MSERSPIPPSTPPADLLRALDFADELAAREAEHRRELEALLYRLIEVLDACERLLAGRGAPRGGWRRSLRLLGRQLEATLTQADVVPIDCRGRQADPEEHEIVASRPGAEAADDVILDVLTRGYRWRGRVLRRPQVIIASHAEEKTS